MDIEDIFLFINSTINKEKIVLGPIDENTHATIQLGLQSKKLDIHLTTETFIKEYETILQIQHSTISNILSNFQNDFIGLTLKYYSTYINLGKLKKFNSYVMPLSIEEISKYIKIEQRNKRFKFKKVIKENEFDKLLLKVNDIDFNLDRYALFGFKKVD